MWKVGKEFSIKLGGKTYKNTQSLVAYKGISIFKLYQYKRNGTLGVDLDVLNPGGYRLVTLRHGAVVQGEPEDYVFEWDNQEYRITEKGTGRNIAVITRREVDGLELDVSLHLYMPNGFLFEATPVQTNINQSTTSGRAFKKGPAAINI